MPEQTPRMSWPYPSKDATPWYDLFESLVSAMDASAFAAREDRHIVMGDGGPLSWNVASDTLTWGSPILISAAMTGFRWEIPAGSITLNNGEVLYVTLTRNPLQNINLAAQKASVIPNTDDALALAIRVGDVIYWRTGLRMLGGSIPSLSPTQVTTASFVFASSLLNARTSTDPGERVVGGGLFDGSQGVPTKIEFNLVGLYLATGSTGNCRLRLYDVGTESTPSSPDLRSTLTIPFASSGGTRSVSSELAVVDTLSGLDQILDSPRVYEVTAELDGADGSGDLFSVYRGSLEIS